MDSWDDLWDNPEILSALDTMEANTRSINSNHPVFDQGYKSKLGSFNSNPPSNSKRKSEENEGDYIAALRGSKSKSWDSLQKKLYNRGRSDFQGKKQTQTQTFYKTNQNEQSYSRPNNNELQHQKKSGTCFKCGIEGHWANECSQNMEKNCERRTSFVSTSSLNMETENFEKDRLCPCGAGVCNIITSRTEKNPGRRFYRCPKSIEEGRCNFFEWCDMNLETNKFDSHSNNLNQNQNRIWNQSQNQSRNPGQSQSQNRIWNQSQNQTDPILNCSCGNGICSVRISKSEKNFGKKYFCCPLPKNEGNCNFFKWCEHEN